MPANVQEDDEFRPVAVLLGGVALEVVSIDDPVEDEGEWWEPEPVFTMHYPVTLEDGRLLAIFRNKEASPPAIQSLTTYQTRRKTSANPCLGGVNLAPI